jgi:hypothetical protein
LFVVTLEDDEDDEGDGDDEGDKKKANKEGGARGGSYHLFHWFITIALVTFFTKP